jgi:hypothetical protein
VVRAGQVFRAKPNDLMRRVTELGRSLGAPWSQDEKFATLAAWLVLGATREGNRKTRTQKVSPDGRPISG